MKASVRLRLALSVCGLGIHLQTSSSIISFYFWHHLREETLPFFVFLFVFVFLFCCVLVGVGGGAFFFSPKSRHLLLLWLAQTDGVPGGGSTSCLRGIVDRDARRNELNRAELRWAEWAWWLRLGTWKRCQSLKVSPVTTSSNPYSGQNGEPLLLNSCLWHTLIC